MPTALLYHAIMPPPTEGTQLFVDPDRFAWQLQELVRRGIRTLTLEEFHLATLAGGSLPNRVLLSFDDAYAHALDAVTPLLVQHGFTAAVFVPWGHVSGRNNWDRPGEPAYGLEIAPPGLLVEAVNGP